MRAILLLRQSAEKSLCERLMTPRVSTPRKLRMCLKQEWLGNPVASIRIIRSGTEGIARYHALPSCGLKKAGRHRFTALQVSLSKTKVILRLMWSITNNGGKLKKYQPSLSS
ncbi:uncharacterized protein PHALS_03035 [Plasmopara halstedii]|uniref:Uncharacterized protein n=1 Tax=Plasmopara halstedii TaxID=4781 RepID=A0A0P1A8J9_PLAHL|nr:uncharacterized protein PHALS_03035 [Plasmopara halstedii]CEG36487.1 hypothetical protein PHALS_03035 [Plasmopara halstedii]|eukprot:XP_024572856.1 hypothetical protein PHALS_03035 [Plasmopara halstedii]